MPMDSSTPVQDAQVDACSISESQSQLLQHDMRAIKLLKIIETSNISYGIKRSAAKQISEIITKDNRDSILKDCLRLLWSKNVDTRNIVSTIFQDIELYSDDDSLFVSEKKHNLVEEIKKIVKKYPPLTASSGAEYQLGPHDSLDAKKQRQTLKKELGLVEGIDEFANEIIKDEDFIITSKGGDANRHKEEERMITPTVKATSIRDKEKKSAKERLMEKRLSKASLKVDSTIIGSFPASPSIASSMPPSPSPASTITLTNTSLSSGDGHHEMDSSLSLPPPSSSLSSFNGMNDNIVNRSNAPEWFQSIRSSLMNPNWYCRNGSLLALRAMKPLDFMIKDLLIVLCLDRVVDFVGDQCQAYNKELSAQCLGRLNLSPSIISELMNAFKDCWHLKHALLLTVKYLIIENDDVDQLSTSHEEKGNSKQENDLEVLFKIALDSLMDVDDDVKALSADILSSLHYHHKGNDHLMKVSMKNGKLLQNNDYDQIIEKCLNDLDANDSSSTFIISLFKLILKAYNNNNNNNNSNKEGSLSKILSKIWPYSRYPSVLVKSLFIEVLQRFAASNTTTSISNSTTTTTTNRAAKINSKSEMSVDIEGIKTAIQLAFQMLILDEEMRGEHLQDLITRLFTPLRIMDRQRIALQLINNIYDSIIVPLDKPFDRKKFLLFPTTMEYELGFKQADFLVIDKDGALTGRVMAAQSLGRLLRLSFIKQQKEWLLSKINISKEGERDRVTSALSLFLTCLIAKETDNAKDIHDLLSNYLFGVDFCKFQEINSAIIETNVAIRPKKINMESDIPLLLASSTSTITTTKSDDSAMIFVERLWKMIQLWKMRFNALIGNEEYLLESLKKETIFPLKRMSALKLLPSKNVMLELYESSQLSSLEMFISVHSMTVEGNDLYSCLSKEYAHYIIRYTRTEYLELHFEEYWEMKQTDSLVEIVLKSPISIERFIKEFKMEILDLMCLEALLKKCDNIITPYAPIFLSLIIGLVGCQEEARRRLANSCFAMLVCLLNLESVMLPAESVMHERLESSLSFVNGLIYNKIESFKIPCKINAQLRPYQEDGVNWLAFLRRYGLHGVLADDMGLGKTLQTLVILASHHYEQSDSISLIVCPSSLTSHWEAEIVKYCPDLASQRILVYTGSNRKSKMAPLKQSSIIITSYDILRIDGEYLTENRSYAYCILDEGHLIRNTETKLYSAIKQIRASHRLILTGTPIQNHIYELFALYDWLMPGFLGNSQQEFMNKYGKIVESIQPNTMTSFTSGSSHATTIGSGGGSSSNSTVNNEKEWKRAEQVLLSLHKQVLPFMLRRMKEMVLKDLPPKIIQDWLCEASPLQRLLFDALEKGFYSSTTPTSIIDDDDGYVRRDNGKSIGEGGDKQHIFKILHLLRSICTDPRPFADKTQVEACVKMEEPSIPPKLQALKDLLSENDGGNHRFLVFAQSKSTLDLVERYVMKNGNDIITNDQYRSMNNDDQAIRFLRLDGSIPASERHAISTRFNTDSSISVLLLTTSVGGLGLTLTGADIVVFLEHDWNPQKDLQAMDRAHRIGQQKTVMVYRIIIKNSIEERIMGLQKWKQKVAGTIVKQQQNPNDNSSEFREQFDVLDLLAKRDEVIDDNKGEMVEEFDEYEYESNQIIKKIKKD